MSQYHIHIEVLHYFLFFHALFQSPFFHIPIIPCVHVILGLPLFLLPIGVDAYISLVIYLLSPSSNDLIDSISDTLTFVFSLVTVFIILSFLDTFLTFSSDKNYVISYSGIVRIGEG